MPLAFYRKYRPRRFSDLIGQEHIADLFKNAAKVNRLAHAYLFAGPRGTGKTTTARLIAKIANCRDEQFLRDQGEACGQCAACAEIDAGRALDVIEIDAASNRGIDEIRNVRENVKSSPSSFRKKIFIIDEAHMLTKEAFNALLKTLEEPPEHAIFILATTEAEKIPPTIASRSQRFYFKRLTVRAIADKLQQISGAEDLRLEPAAAELIAAAADGSVRDAESLLDQLSSFSKTIDVSMVEKTVGQIGFKKVIRLADLIIKRDLNGSLAYLADLRHSGANLTELIKELIAYLRRALSLKFDPQLAAIFQEDLTGEQTAQLIQHSALITPDRQITLLKSLIRAYGEMRYSPFPHIPIEVAIIENLGQN